MPVYARTVPVMERHRFDVASLDRYLRDHLAGYRGGLEVRQFDSGIPTRPSSCRPRWPTASASDFVLRKKPPGQLVASAHQVDREFRVISALAQTDVPVAPAHLLCADDCVIGQMFYIMSCVEGRILIDPSMPDQTPAERAAIFDSMNDVLARLHKVDPVEGRARRLRPHRPVHRPPARALDQAICRAQDRGYPGDGEALGLAARAHPGRRSDDHRPWRLSPRQPDRPSDRAAHRRRARLGAHRRSAIRWPTSPTTASAIT